MFVSDGGGFREWRPSSVHQQKNTFISIKTAASPLGLHTGSHSFSWNGSKAAASDSRAGRSSEFLHFENAGEEAEEN